MAKIKLSVSVADSHLKHIAKVAEAAEKAGMKVEHRHDSLGVLTGSIDESKLANLNQVTGVSHVEQERTVGINPPDGTNK